MRIDERRGTGYLGTLTANTRTHTQTHRHTNTDTHAGTKCDKCLVDVLRMLLASLDTNTLRHRHTSAHRCTLHTHTVFDVHWHQFTLYGGVLWFHLLIQLSTIRRMS